MGSRQEKSRKSCIFEARKDIVMKFKTLIWDLDGTLLDTLQDLAEAVNHALRTCGMPERSIDEVRQFVGNGIRMLMRRAVPDGEENPRFEECFAEFRAYYMLHSQNHTCLYPGIGETLQTLHSMGVRMAVVSNKLQAGVDRLYQTWFQDTIEVAIGERPELRRKPAPDMVDQALKELGVRADEAVYVGDSDVDIQTARNSGLPCISVLWGFRSREVLEEAGATCFVDQPNDIITIIQQI